MKYVKFLSLSFIFVSFLSYADERSYSKEFGQCSKGAASLDVRASCINAEIALQKRRLNFAYAKLSEKLNASDREYLDKVQREWITWRDGNYNFLSEHVAGEFGTTRITSLDFLLNSVFDRVRELEMMSDEMGEN